jgi:hypothetical protein
MKRALIVLIALGITATAAGAASDGHVKATLEPVGGSGVTGTVQLVQLPGGGTNIHVNARGLTPGVEYASFYYTDQDCDEDPDLIGNYTATSAGVGATADKADEDLDEIGSVSVRSPDYSVLYACAAVG